MCTAHCRMTHTKDGRHRRIVGRRTRWLGGRSSTNPRRRRGSHAHSQAWWNNRTIAGSIHSDAGSGSLQHTRKLGDTADRTVRITGQTFDQLTDRPLAGWGASFTGGDVARAVRGRTACTTGRREERSPTGHLDEHNDGEHPTLTASYPVTSHLRETGRSIGEQTNHAISSRDSRHL